MAVNPERQRMLDYLSSYGLNGEHIRASSVGEDGYNRIDFPDEGYYRLPWPEGFRYTWFLALRDVAHKADLRRDGVKNGVIH